MVGAQIASVTMVGTTMWDGWGSNCERDDGWYNHVGRSGLRLRIWDRMCRIG